MTIQPDANGRVQFNQVIRDVDADTVRLLDVRVTHQGGTALGAGFQKPSWLAYTAAGAIVDGEYRLTLTFDLPFAELEVTTYTIAVQFTDDRNPAVTASFLLTITEQIAVVTKIYVIDRTTGHAAEILPDGTRTDQPIAFASTNVRGIAYNPDDGRIYVAAYGSDAIESFDPTNIAGGKAIWCNSPTYTNNPGQVRYNVVDQMLYWVGLWQTMGYSVLHAPVANFGSTELVVNPSTLSQAVTMDTRYFTFDVTGTKILLGSSTTGSLVVVDVVAKTEAAAYTVGSLTSVCTWHPTRGTFLYASSATIREYDPASGTDTVFTAMPNTVASMEPDYTGKALYVHTSGGVYLVDKDGNQTAIATWSHTAEGITIIR